jgi:hypothetical protein
MDESGEVVQGQVVNMSGESVGRFYDLSELQGLIRIWTLQVHGNGG